MTDLTRRLASLSPQQRALLESRLRQRPSTNVTKSQIEVRDATVEAIPLSFEQQRLWFIDQLAPGNPAYNSPLALRLRGPLDIEIFQRSLEEIVRRHEVLRTTFEESDGQPVQRIHAEQPVPLRNIDLRGFSEEARESEAYRLACEEAQHPFDIVRGPMLRSTLLHMREKEFILILAFHHIAVDAWSIVIFFRELAALYDAFGKQLASPLPPLPLQYADYALWQRQALQGPEFEAHLAYWREHLANLPTLQIPTDHPRQMGTTAKGQKLLFVLPSTLKEKLLVMSQRNQATLFMTLLTAFQILLTHYSGQEEIVLGTSVAGRARKELDGLIGFFINMLVLRTRFVGSLHFHEALKQVREECLRAYAHQDIPFERLVQELHPERNVGRMPLFQVLFQSIESISEGGTFPGIELEPYTLQTGTSKFDILVSVRERGPEISMEWEYDTSLFEVETMYRMIAHYQMLLESLVEMPEQRIDDLAMLTPTEQHQMVEVWNQTQVPFPETLCLHHLFEAQALRQPDAVAMGQEERELTYEQLNRKANQLAHSLRRYGVGPDVVVGLCVERSMEMVVGILGILKAGGAYAPLDPNYPESRLAYMLNEVKAPVIVTQHSLLSSLPQHNAHVICLDTDWESIANEKMTTPVSGVNPSNLAYVISTSGSTGTPKGIALAHRGVVNNITDLNRRFGVDSDDSVLALSSLSFDMCVYEVLGVLGAGGTIVLPPVLSSKDPACWVSLLLEKGITLWNSAPSLLELMISHCERSNIKSLPLRLALLGGDWVPISLPDRLKELAPGLAFISLGGATEASIHSIIYPVEATDPNWKSIPYGRPMANQEAYILDPQQRLVPVGVSGELHLGGVGLARGYISRPDLTASKFVPHPFSQQPGARLYKTGDVARYRKDGVIELLGRMDFLVKIRGLRIELGEIEATLKQHPAVQAVVVVVRDDQIGDKRLVAYVVGTEKRLESAELRAFVRGRLPDYMQPQVYVFLERLPLSPNGKVDRKGLPDPEMSRQQAQTLFEPPIDELERQLVRIWSDVLGIEQIGVTDNFFELGGDSFKAIRVVRASSATLPLIDFFTHATIRELATRLRTVVPPSSRLLYELTGHNEAPALSFVCVPYGGGNVVSYQSLATRLPREDRLYAVALPGHDIAHHDQPLLPLVEIARLCVEEIIQTIQGGLLALYGQCAGVALTLEIARQLEEKGVPLQAVYLGAALPDPEPLRSIKLGNEVSDEDLREWLQYLGGLDDIFEPEDMAHILSVVRHDLIAAAEYYRYAYEVAPRKLKTPLICIVGTEDAATREYEKRYQEWGQFGTSVNIRVLDGARHYFVKHNAQELASIICQSPEVLQQKDRGDND